ncbi:MAG TPA: DUF397 domain-containing protein [Gemmataceae bacterium]|nr:DUF397 domain-containing protein [Gemmataceae bacterium]
MGAAGKPTTEDLGIDVEKHTWWRSSEGVGAIEVAFADARDQQWVLMRVADDPGRRVLVYDRHEWECFVDGAKKGEFDDAAR